MQTQTGTESPRNSPKAPLAADDDALMTSNQTRALVGNVSNMCIWRWQRDPRVMFPAPDVVINKRSYWRRGTIRRWQAAQAAQTATKRAA